MTRTLLQLLGTKPLTIEELGGIKDYLQESSNDRGLFCEVEFGEDKFGTRQFAFGVQGRGNYLNLDCSDKIAITANLNSYLSSRGLDLEYQIK